jgi:putative transposase
VANYRRSLVPGGSFFFTLSNRGSALLTEKIDVLRLAFRLVASDHPFSLDAVVILPEHLHCIWTLPTGDPDFATRWRLIKTEFSKKIAAIDRRSSSRVSKGERGIWQRRYWEHTIRDERDFARHCDYIHFNPVKHGHAARADWPFSSFKKFVRSGMYPMDWGGSRRDDGLRCGERKTAD